MEYSNINWILAMVCLLAGGGFGALAQRLTSGAADRQQQLRQQLAERERELAQLRERASEHIAQLSTAAGRLRHEAQALEQRLADDAANLGVAAPTRTTDDAAVPAAEALAEPRDYADGSGGTLSEDFGLKPSPDEVAEPQPPRY